MGFFDSVLRLLYPNRCGCCGKSAGTKYFCETCQKKLERIPYPVCRFCGNSARECKYCSRSNYYDTLCAPFYYIGVAKSAVLRFKFYSQPQLAAAFAPEMTQRVLRLHKEKAFDLICPVPMTKRAEAQRGYNQSDLLASRIGRCLFIPVKQPLLKVRETPPQHSLSALERLINVKDVFAVNPEDSVKGKIILLCDDIKTTGATLNECAKGLRAAGALEVHAVCAAIVHTDFL